MSTPPEHQETNAQPTEQPPRGRWYQFGLAGLTMFVAFLSCLYGVWARRAPWHVQWRVPGVLVSGWDGVPCDRLLIRQGDRLRVFDPDSGGFICTLANKEVALFVAFSADGRRLVTAYFSGALGLWDAHSGEEIPLTLDDSDQDLRLSNFRLSKVLIFNSVSLSPTGRWLAVNATLITSQDEMQDGGILIDTESGNLFNLEFGTELRFAAGGIYVYARKGNSGAILRTGDASPPFDVTVPGSSNVSVGEFSPDARYFARGTEGGVRVWETATGRAIAAHEKNQLGGKSKPPMTVTFLPDGRLLAAPTQPFLLSPNEHAQEARDRTMHLLDPGTGAQLESILVPWGTDQSLVHWYSRQRCVVTESRRMHELEIPSSIGADWAPTEGNSMESFEFVYRLRSWSLASRALLLEVWDLDRREHLATVGNGRAAYFTRTTAKKGDVKFIFVEHGEDPHIQVWARRHPERWWGHAHRPEVWAALALGLLWLWRVFGWARNLRGSFTVEKAEG